MKLSLATKLSALVLVVLALSLTGCATLKGAGEDLEAAGQAIQDAAEGN